MLYERGFLAATDGNISVRLNEDLILCTPTSLSKGMMEPEDLVIVDQRGCLQCGKRRASTELGMHLLYYSIRPDAVAVLHAHPPSATGFAAAGSDLQPVVISETAATIGVVPVAPYGMPGTPHLENTLKPFMRNHNAILMGHHGAVTCGETLLNAYLIMEALEHYAKIAAIARQLSHTKKRPACTISSR